MVVVGMCGVGVTGILLLVQKRGYIEVIQRYMGFGIVATRKPFFFSFFFFKFNFILHVSFLVTSLKFLRYGACPHFGLLK